MINKKVAYSKMSFRFLGVLIDFFLFGVLFFVLSSFVFRYTFDSQAEDNLIATAQVESGLLVKDKNGYYQQLHSSDYEDYKEVVETYYLTDKYFGSEFYKENSGDRKPYTIKEYNTKILELGTDYTYFEYQYDENNNIDENKLGILKEENYTENDRENGTLTIEAKNNLMVFYSRHYREIYSDLYKDNFYSIARESVINKGVYRIFCSAIIPYVLVFAIPPLTNKYGFTLGRFLTKVGLVSKDGIYQKRYFFLIRNIPTIILLCIILIEDNIFVLAPIYGAFFLFNWLATLMNRENASILDLISFSRVCNTKESTIYENLEELEADQENGED